MIIILKKDGQIVTDEANPVDVKAMDNAAMILADPQDGNTIVYNASAGMWVAVEGGGSFSPDITNPQDGDTLVYDGTAQKWVNGSGGGGSSLTVVHMDSVTNLLDVKAGELFGMCKSGIVMVEQSPDVSYGIIYGFVIENGAYYFSVTFGGGYFEAASSDDYPELHQDY